MSKFYLDEKVTLWQRSYFATEDDMKTAISMLKEEKSVSDICMTIDFVETKELLETMESMTVRENNFEPTIEVFKGEKRVFSNGLIK